MAYNIAISVTMGVGSLFLVVAAWKLAAVFGWEMYRFLGAYVFFLYPLIQHVSTTRYISSLPFHYFYSYAACNSDLQMRRTWHTLIEMKEDRALGRALSDTNNDDPLTTNLGMHKAYEILITLLKFDVFFFVAFAIQLFTLVDTTDKMVLARIDGRDLSRQQVLIGLGIPASIILLGLAFFGVMKEKKFVTIFVMLCLVAVEPYFIYQIVYIHLPAHEDRFKNSMKYLTFFSKCQIHFTLMRMCV